MIKDLMNVNIADINIQNAQFFGFGYKNYDGGWA